MTPQYPVEGLDCGWLASDRDGRVAIFLTSGFAPIPEKIASRTYFDVLEEKLDALSPRTTAEIFVPTKHAGDFPDFAVLGLFVFYWWDTYRESHDNVYELVAAPAEPILIGDFHADVAAMAAEVPFALSFEGLHAVDAPAPPLLRTADALETYPL
jgi:hypothetical protein